MNILSLKVKNFRSFERTESEIEFVLRKGINVIVGENNVGKSSLLRVLRIISGQIGHSQLDFYKEEQQRELLLEIELELNNDEMKYFVGKLVGINKYLDKPENLNRFIKDFGNIFSLKYSSKSGFSITSSFFRFDQKFGFLVTNYSPKSTFSLGYNTFLDAYFSTSKDLLIDILKSRTNDREGTVRVSFAGVSLEIIRGLLLQKIKIFSEIRKRPFGANKRDWESLDCEYVADVLSSLKNGNRTEMAKFERIKQEFNQLFPNLKLAVRGGPGITPPIFIEKSPIDHEMPIENVGAGIGEMIIILTHLVYSKDLIFGLDLPEMQFHPHAQRLLLKVLEENSKNNQILIVTHSPMLLNPKKLENIVIIREQNGASFVSQLPDGYFTEDERKKERNWNDFC